MEVEFLGKKILNALGSGTPNIVSIVAGDVTEEFPFCISGFGESIVYVTVMGFVVSVSRVSNSELINKTLSMFLKIKNPDFNDRIPLSHFCTEIDI